VHGVMHKKSERRDPSEENWIFDSSDLDLKLFLVTESFAQRGITWKGGGGWGKRRSNE
jgi:hypothetical protein